MRTITKMENAKITKASPKVAFAFGVNILTMIIVAKTATTETANHMQKIIYLMRYKRNASKNNPQPLAYAHDVDEVRDFFERAGERTTGKDWFIGFTEHFTYPITKLPTLKQFESAGTKPNGKY